WGLAGPPSDHLAARDGNFLLGHYAGAPMSCAGLRRRDADTVELTRVFVRPCLRGTGGGARLLAAVDEAARSLGARRIVLDTRLDLVEARALYTRHGYREIPAYSSGPYAQVWYGKELAG
ncbi:GNAT family N-acetyltransferase, partial [Kitasatospora sp. NPDC059803]|uniref:GNAT family N-acetyltransferase n=1 Tax=Kitasatospora sp. NPDC059803 TaxID=3346953 RepID=UPI00365D1005